MSGSKYSHSPPGSEVENITEVLNRLIDAEESDAKDDANWSEVTDWFNNRLTAPKPTQRDINRFIDRAARKLLLRYTDALNRLYAAAIDDLASLKTGSYLLHSQAVVDLPQRVIELREANGAWNCLNAIKALIEDGRDVMGE